MSESATLDAATVKDVRDEVNSQPIETLNVAQSSLFQADAMWPYFERLRAEDPVHWTPAGDFEPHWAVTRYNDIMTVDTNHEVFSSEGGISLRPERGDDRQAGGRAARR